jgi:hypothetical protein
MVYLLLERVMDELAVSGQIADERVLRDEGQLLLARPLPFDEGAQGAQPVGAA